LSLHLILYVLIIKGANMSFLKYQNISILICLFLSYQNIFCIDNTKPRSMQDGNLGFIKQDDEIRSYISPIPNSDSLIFEEMKIKEDGKARPQLYGYAYEVNLNTQNSGIWETLKNGDRIWRLKITCPKAYSINLLFEDFKLSESSDICIYNNKHDFIIGPFNSRFNKKHGIYSTHLTMGEDIVVDLF